MKLALIMLAGVILIYFIIDMVDFSIKEEK
jgi:hypothetical protein